MEKKHLSIVQKVSIILLCTFALNFAGGCLVLWQLEKSNIRYIYRLEEKLLGENIRDLEEDLEDIQDILYNMIVSKDIQQAGSLLLEAGGEASGFWQVSCLNTIMAGIQQKMQESPYIPCANYIDLKGETRVVAATRGYRLSEQAAAYVEEQAAAAEGRLVILDGRELTGEENMMVFARELREKKDLSLKHMGVIVLFVDVEKLAGTLTEVNEGIFILRSQNLQEGRLSYILNDSEKVLEGYDLEQLNQEGYSIRRVSGKKYFAVVFGGESSFFSYVLLAPYSELFQAVDRAFGLYIGLFLWCGVAVLTIALLSASRMTRDIRLFIRHISGLPGENMEKIPFYEGKPIKDRDVFVLQGAFNSMITRMNELVRDNYQKQLLIKETQLQALQSQMNPHFLYNTLNSLYWMAKTAEMSAAADMISSLGILLREAISDREFVITIDKELDIVCHYFIIQKHRYEDRLEVSFDISEDCSSLMIPKFSLQPLVENAIAHGLECMLEPCTIQVRSFIEGERCICQVRNSGPAPEEDLISRLEQGSLKPKGNGVGLLNIHRRVKSVFGEEYGVSVFREGNETVAQITMSCIQAREYQEDAQDGKHIQDYDSR